MTAVVIFHAVADLYSPDRKQILAVNGEIYNHRDVRAKYAGKYDFHTGSDCEVILALYRDKGIHFLEELNGIFAFALYDEEKDDFLIARVLRIISKSNIRILRFIMMW